MSDKINWFKDTDGAYKKTLRGHSAVITILASGQAELVIDGGAPATYTTRRLAKEAFQHFLNSIPVS